MKKDALDDILVDGSQKKRAGKEVYTWWESRRLKFNLISASVGIFNILLFAIFNPAGIIKYDQIAFMMLFVFAIAISFAILGNLFDFLGWLIELLTSRGPNIGPLLFVIITMINCIAIFTPLLFLYFLFGYY